MITEFTFVRHGETDANENGILQGQSDSTLNCNGVKQAEKTAAYLERETFDLAVSSDLARAVATARAILAHGHDRVPFATDPALREWCCGAGQGMTLAEVAARWPDYRKYFSGEIADGRIPGGESCAEVQARVDAFLERMTREHAGKRILLVSHNGVLQRIFRRIVGPVSGDRLFPRADNGSVSTFRYCHECGAWQLTGWNGTGHLRELTLHRASAW